MTNKARYPVLCLLLLAASLLVPATSRASVDGACLADSCEMCGMGGVCFMQALSQCTHPACFIGGAVGGAAGAIGGGIVGFVPIGMMGMALYPGVSPAVAMIGAIFVGAGIGMLLVGVTGMMLGEVMGRSLCYADAPTMSAKKRGRGRR